MTARLHSRRRADRRVATTSPRTDDRARPSLDIRGCEGQVPDPGFDDWELGPTLDAAMRAIDLGDDVADEAAAALGSGRELTDEAGTRAWLRNQDLDELDAAVGDGDDLARQAAEWLGPRGFDLSVASSLARVPLDVITYVASAPSDAGPVNGSFAGMQRNLLRIAARDLVTAAELRGAWPEDPERIDVDRTHLRLPPVFRSDPRLVELIDAEARRRLSVNNWSVALRMRRQPPSDPFEPGNGFAEQGSWAGFDAYCLRLGAEDLQGLEDTLARNLTPDVVGDVAEMYGFMFHEHLFRTQVEAAAALRRPDGDGDLAHQIVGQDVMYEQMTRWCYGSLDADGERTLASWGYVKHTEVSDGQFGLQLMSFVPTEGRLAAHLAQAQRPLRPVLAFAGTNPGEAVDVVDDLTTGGIGLRQFHLNERLIIAQLDALSAHGPVDVIGHSLGGALAQLTSVVHRGPVGRVVTFQAPGVSHTAKLLEAHQRRHDAESGAEPVHATHYQVIGDPVGLAGHGRTVGIDRVTRPEKLESVEAIHAHTGRILPELHQGSGVTIGTELGIAGNGKPLGPMAQFFERPTPAGPYPLEADRREHGAQLEHLEKLIYGDPADLATSYLIDRGIQLLSDVGHPEQAHHLQGVYSELYVFEQLVRRGMTPQQAVDHTLPAAGLPPNAAARVQRCCNLLQKRLGNPPVTLDFTPRPPATEPSETASEPPAPSARGGGGPLRPQADPRHDF